MTVSVSGKASRKSLSVRVLDGVAAKRGGVGVLRPTTIR